MFQQTVTAFSSSVETDFCYNLYVSQAPKKKAGLRKAPGAPKRFKSPYICFSIEMRDEIKKGLPSDAKVTDIMKVRSFAPLP